MRYEFISSAAAMAANGNLSEITPWRIIIDTEEQTITVSKRNKFRMHSLYMCRKTLI